MVYSESNNNSKKNTKIGDSRKDKSKLAFEMITSSDGYE
jgi:hypothetical protein